MSWETDEQRMCDFAWLRATNGGEAQGYPPIVRRLLAEYDAVLARAEAADELARTRGQNNRVLEADNADQLDRRRAAESRLAEATALLTMWLAWSKGRVGRAELIRRTRALLSATPAQAAGTPEQQFQEWAETHPDNPERRTPAQAAEPGARDSIARYLEHVSGVEVGTVVSKETREIIGWCASWVRNRLDEKWAKGIPPEQPCCDQCGYILPAHHACCGKMMAAERAEHPDTIALRECRTFLGNCQSGAESARAERDSTAESWRSSNLQWQKRCDELSQALGGARAERDTALARIAELEADNNRLDEQWHIAQDTLDMREGCIARAVAELEKALSPCQDMAYEPVACIRRALVALR